VLVIHDDGETLDVLTRAFEDAGCDVVTAISLRRAQMQLGSDLPLDVVVAPWDTKRSVGGDVYRWVLERKYELRDLFVFLGSDPPPGFDELVDGRCLLVPLAQMGELVPIALATITRREQLTKRRSQPKMVVARPAPRLLLVEDDPILVVPMAELLDAAGYAVSACESGNEAITLLGSEDFDALVVDWHMLNGSGADVYRWLQANKPKLAERVVFLADSESDDASEVAPERPMIRKGQDSHSLTAVLREIVGERPQAGG
jgi:DNA-binding response OmpR family regulator